MDCLRAAVFEFAALEKRHAKLTRKFAALREKYRGDNEFSGDMKADLTRAENDRDAFESENLSLKFELLCMTEERDELKMDLAKTENDSGAFESEVGSLTEELELVAAERDQLKQALAEVENDRDAFESERDLLSAEVAQLTALKEAVEDERDGLKFDVDNWCAMYEDLLLKKRRLKRKLRDLE